MSRCIDRAPKLPKRATFGLLILLSAMAACDAPNFEGPQLQDPPQGFLLQPDSRAARSMFAHLPEIHHDAWVQSLPPYSTIRINGYAGALSLVDVMAAQDSARAHVQDADIRFSAIEPVMIDGREAMAWEERIETPQRGIPWVAYRVMIPYDTVSYTIEFSTEDPIFKAGAPGSLRDVVATFGIGETVYNWPLIAIGIGLLLFAAYVMRQRSKAKARQLRSIRLVQVKKKDDEEKEAVELDDGELVGAGTPPPSRAARPRPGGPGGSNSTE